MTKSWFVWALLSALFAGATAILAKVGVKDVDSNLATAIRTTVILFFTWALFLVTNSVGNIGSLSKRTWIYRLLYTGGWLTYHYDLHDPNVINLILAVVEPLVMLGVISYWVWRTRFLYRLLFISFIVQLLIDVGFLAFILTFFFTWKPK